MFDYKKIKQKRDIFVKVKEYNERYNNRYYILIKLFGYIVNELFHFDKHYSSKQNNKLNIAIETDGAIGDNIACCLWIKEFSKILDLTKTNIDVFSSIKLEIYKSLVKNINYISNIFDRQKISKNKHKYDVIIKFRKFPEIFYANDLKVQKLSPDLFKFIEKANDFRNRNSKFFDFDTLCDSQIQMYSICRNEKRFQQVDIEGFFNINNTTKWNMCLDYNMFNILDKYNLSQSEYITLARSVDQKQKMESNIRLWSIDYYETLVNNIKNKYPNVKIIQLGVNRDKLIKNVDIDLRGKTNFEELKILLKHSLLHIDGECGMVHLKHALYGKSCVLFGPTSIECDGYDENINLKSDGCSSWCEWISDNWQTNCIKGFKDPPCMKELYPNYVFEKIVPYLDTIYEKDNKNIQILEIGGISNDFKNIKNKKIVFFGEEFYEFSKTISNINNVAIYDYKLDNLKIQKAKQNNILLEYGDIYNIPEWANTCDIVVIKDKSIVNKYYAIKELQRILKKDSKVLLLK